MRKTFSTLKSKGSLPTLTSWTKGFDKKDPNIRKVVKKALGKRCKEEDKIFKAYIEKPKNLLAFTKVQDTESNNLDPKLSHSRKNI